MMTDATAAGRLPAHERRLLIAHVAGWDRAHTPGAGLLPAESAAVEALAERRLAGEPLQHVTGVAYFRHETLAVGPGVFVPRPETEVMAGWAIEQLTSRQEPTVVELCAGSGAISRAIHREAPGCRQFAVELSPDAVGWLSRNLAGTGVSVVEGDMAEALPQLDGEVDLVVCNPPYVPLEAWEGLPRDVRDFDPPLALFSGPDGLDAMRVLVGTARRLLRTGGLLCAEHAECQHDQVMALFTEAGGFDQIRDHRDLAGRWRFLTARRTTVEG